MDPALEPRPGPWLISLWVRDCCHVHCWQWQQLCWFTQPVHGLGISWKQHQVLSSPCNCPQSCSGLTQMSVELAAHGHTCNVPNHGTGAHMSHDTRDGVHTKLCMHGVPGLLLRFINQPAPRPARARDSAYIHNLQLEVGFNNNQLMNEVYGSQL